jgi:DNA-binding GntR family transcriptional regulator
VTEPSGVLAFRRVGAADQIAEVLRARILGGELRPGDPLTEAELAREFDVSRNTVREGLRLLTRDGLAVHEVHRGVAVRQFDVNEVRDIYGIRSLIQREVARCAGHLTEDDAEGLRDENHKVARCRASGDARGWMDHSMRFHSGLVALMGNPRLNKIFTEVLRENQMVLSALDRLPDQRWDEHDVALLRHLEEGDKNGYRKAVTDYLEGSCADVLRLMAERD